MKGSTLAIAAALLLLLGIGASLVYADTVVADIQFPFMAGGKEYPAGKYEIETSASMEELTLRSVATGKGGLLPFTTRLAQREPDVTELVFDKAGDKYYLSEIYMPGIDGFGLKGAPGKHTHVKIKAGKTGKK